MTKDENSLVRQGFVLRLSLKDICVTASRPVSMGLTAGQGSIIVLGAKRSGRHLPNKRKFKVDYRTLLNLSLASNHPFG